MGWAELIYLKPWKLTSHLRTAQWLCVETHWGAKSGTKWKAIPEKTGRGTVPPGLGLQWMGSVNTTVCSVPELVHKTLTPLLSFLPCSPWALLRSGTLLKAWRMSADGLTSSRSQTQTTMNTMIMPSSSHGKTLGLQACKVSLLLQGFRKEGGWVWATGPTEVLEALAQAREGVRAGLWPLQPWKSMYQGWRALTLKNHQGLCHFPQETSCPGETVKIRGDEVGRI